MKPVHLVGIWKTGTNEAGTPTYTIDCDEHDWHEFAIDSAAVGRVVIRHLREHEEEL